MNTELITEEDLMQATKYKKRTYLIKWLDQEKIPYKQVGFDRRVLTTRSAINYALMGHNPYDDAIELL